MPVMASKIWYWLARYFGECKKKKINFEHNGVQIPLLFYFILSSQLLSIFDGL